MNYIDYRVNEVGQFQAMPGKPNYPAINRLEPGLYTHGQDINGVHHLSVMNPISDGYIHLPNGPMDQVSGIIKQFFASDTRALYDKYSVLYKRGLLMYGPPGTGKTLIVQQIGKWFKERDIVGLVGIFPDNVSEVAGAIRAIEGDRPIVVIWEEFERYLCAEAQLLQLLDGTEQVDNIFYLMTTNHLHKLPQRLYSRPSRIADMVEVGAPPASIRRAYIEGKLLPDDTDVVNVDEWVKGTEGFMLDHIKDLLISNRIYGVPLQEGIKKLKNMTEAQAVQKSFQEHKKTQRIFKGVF